MIKNFIIARPYANALFQLAKEQQRVENWSKMLDFMAEVAKDPQTKRFLADPRATWEKRVALFSDICDDHLDDYGKQLVQVLAAKRRLNILPELAAMYTRRRARDENVSYATVTSAFPVATAMQELLAKALTKKLRHKIICSFEQDSSLIGGTIIQIRSFVIDGSIRGQLQRLQEQLTRAY